MVAALVKGKRIEIHDLEDLRKIVDASIDERETLVLISDQNEHMEVSPAPQLSEAELIGKRQKAWESAFGSWRGLVDTEQLKRDIYSSRGQRPRDWMVSEPDPEE